MDERLGEALAALGLTPLAIFPLKENPSANSCWLVEVAGGEPVVLRRYHDTASVDEVAYEHQLLAHLDRLGWVVPYALTPVVEVDGRLHCATSFVPGQSRLTETTTEQAQRGRDLARLQHAMRPLTTELGQRPGWRSQHQGTTVHTELDWEHCLHLFQSADGRLAAWADAAANSSATELRSLGADELPVTMIHGDFAEWNLHYAHDGSLAGVLDFGLSHVDSRPYELAIARTYRAPAVITAYRTELRHLGWPLSELEEAAIPALHHAFRVDMVAWALEEGRRSGIYDLDMIERQLARTGVPNP